MVQGTLQQHGNHAVVIGGSMAGMLAARVLAEHFAHVTIVDRDHWPAEPEFRAGVPQGRHVHIFLARGQQVLEQIFPGIGAKVIAAGAVPIDILNDLQYYSGTGAAPRFPSALRLYLSSRPLLETLVQQELARQPAITFRPGVEAVALVTDDAGRVAGVELRPRTGTVAAPTETLAADFVVDASGRDSRAPEWLTALGYDSPTQTTVDSHLGYASRIYRRPANAGQDWQALLIPEQAPAILRGGVIWPVEDDQWIVTLAGSGGDYPPTDDAGFLDYTRGMVHQALYTAIKDAEPLSPIYGYRRTANQLRHYERLKRLPANFIVVGDAVCAFNPVYGQGMTAAVLGAVVLQGCWQRYGRERAALPLQFQRALARSNTTPWLLATGSDFRVPGVEGALPPRSARLTHRYLDGVLELITRDREIYTTFIQVAHLLKPPTALFRPTIAAKVGWHLLRQRGKAAH